MKNLLVAGNRKLHSSVSSFSITPASCKNSSLCARTCYAVKIYKNKMNAVARNCWDANYEIAKDYDLFIRSMVDEIRVKKPKTIRIHVSGDFFSQGYVDAWSLIAVMFPKVTFYGFSKMFERLDLSAMNYLPNVNIINSILPDGSLNYGLVGTLMNKIWKFEFPYCRYGIDRDVVCGKTCVRCHDEAKRMLFLQH